MRAVLIDIDVISGDDCVLDPEIAAHIGPTTPMPELTPALLGMLRSGMAEIGRGLPGAEITAVTEHSADGVPVRLYQPHLGPDAPLIVFLHGGGWMLGDLDTHDAMMRQLARRSGCAILAVGYRLAPEHPFPAGLDDSAIAFAWARRHAKSIGCDPGRIALGGESAGANLTAALTLRLRDGGEEQPHFQLLIHPVTDMSFAGRSIDELAGSDLSRSYLEACRTFYIGDGDYRAPQVSPLFARDHSGLAPAIVLTAAEDPLRDDGELYAHALVEAGIETLAARLPGLPHGFLFLPANIPAVGQAFDLIARLMRRYFADA